MVCCTSQTNSGVKYSKPVNTVSGCPHEYALCNVEMGLAGLPCNLDRVVTNCSTVQCSLYAIEQLHSESGIESDILWLYLKRSSTFSNWSCFSQAFMRITEKPLSYHPASKYLNGSPAKTTLPQTALQTIPQCGAERCVTVGAEDTMAYHVTWCNHHYETQHLDEMTSSTLMITALVKAQITQWVHLFTRLRRHDLYLT